MLAALAAVLSFGRRLRIKALPSSGASVVPSELKAWVRVSRAEAYRAGPRMATYGLAATCKMVMPDASTNSAPKNSPYTRCEAAG